MRRLYIVIVAFFVFASCIKEELPVEPVPKGDLTTGQIEMGNTYGNQVWFDLDQNQVVQIEDKYGYTLVFSGNDECPRLNTAIGITVAPVENIELGSEIDYTSLNFQTDISTLEQDSLALRNAVEWKGIYAVNLGFDAIGRPLGFAQISIDQLSDLHWVVRVYLESDKTINQVQVDLNKEDDQVGLNITNSDLVALPSVNEYDLLFTTYTYVFYEPEFMFYQVSGALINPHRTMAYQSNDLNFSEYSLNDFTPEALTEWADVIGYDWKYYDYNAGIYAVDPSQIYTIQSRSGYLYKLRFVDFYNETGSKGYPTFEFQRL